MQLVPLSQFNAHDLTSLWNKALGNTFPMREKLMARNLFGDLNFMPECSFAAVVDGQLAGFVGAKLNREFIGVVVPKLAYINSVVVDPAHQRKGIGTALVKAAVAELRKHNPTQIHVGRDTFHFFPGIPEELPGARAFFERIGAKFAEHWETDLISDVTGFELPASVKATLEREPVEIRPARADEVRLLSEHLRRTFAGRWQYEYHKFIYDGGDPADFVIVREGDKIIGFCHIYTPESVWIGPSTYWGNLYPEARFGGYGPLGVDKETRGRGLGLAVVAVAVQELKRRGVTLCGVDWTGLVDFYGKLGFKPWKRYTLTELV